MPTYELEKNGKVYEVEAPNPQAALAALEKMAAPAQSAPAAQPSKEDVIRGALDFSQGSQLSREVASYMIPVGGAARMAPAAARAVTGVVTHAVGANAPRASANFSRVMSKAADAPVDISAAGNAALRIQELAERGSSMPMVARRFLQRVTDPAKGELTYKEARDFASNISRLSANEFGRLTPVMKSEVTKLRFALDKAIEKAAGTVGEADRYRSAMTEYARAMQLQKRAKQAAKQAAKWGAGMVGAGYAYNKLSDLLHP